MRERNAFQYYLCVLQPASREIREVKRRGCEIKVVFGSALIRDEGSFLRVS